MLRIGIVDDNKVFSHYIADIVHSAFEKEDMTYEIQIYETAVNLRFCLESESCGYCDIYILDIQMPKISGLTLASIIRQKYPKTYIIFVTSYEKYGIEGYRYGIYSYILKVSVDTELPPVLKDIAEKIQTKTEPYYVTEDSEPFQRIYYCEIIYIDVQKKYIHFHTKTRCIKVRSSLKQVQAQLGDKRFVFCDQNCIVNTKRVDSIDNRRQEVIMCDGTRLHISIPKSKELKAAMAACWSRLQ